MPITDTRRDRLDDLHARLLAGVREQPDYAAGAVPSISAYSEGAEHALDTVRLQRHLLAPPRVVVRSIEHLAALPHGTAMMTAARSIVQIRDEPEHGHYLLYMGTDLHDSLDPTDLFWDKASRHTLTMILPAVIIHP